GSRRSFGKQSSPRLRAARSRFASNATCYPKPSPPRRSSDSLSCAPLAERIDEALARLQSCRPSRGDGLRHVRSLVEAARGTRARAQDRIAATGTEENVPLRA